MSFIENNSPTKEIFDNLLQLFNSKKFVELEKQLTELLKNYPKSYPLYNLQGAYKKIIGDFDKAEIAFKEAIKISDKIPDAYNNLGLLYIDQKRIDDSIYCFNQAIKNNPNNPFFLNNLGNALAKKNLIDKALNNFKKALTINQSFFLAHNNIGIIQNRLKNFKEAIKSFNEAISIEKNFAEGYMNLGSAYFEIGEVGLALKNYTIAIQKDPKSAKAYNNFGNILKDQGLYNEAIKSYQTSINLQPNLAETYNNLGNVLIDLNKNEEAISSYEKSIKLKPNYFEAINNLANVYFKKKDFVLAIEYYQKAYEINNKYSSALASLIYNKIIISDFSAINDFEKVKNSLGTIGGPIIPFYTLALEDNPKNQKLRSLNYSNQKFEKFYSKKNRIKVYNNKKIKIGYYSSDFFDHATMYLISGLLREHDKEKFETFIFSYGENKKSKLVEDTMNYVSSFKDISKMPDLEIVKLSRDLQIDIAIDLKGYTYNSRSKLFAYVLAPIQINYLGYPGTLGTSFIDYLVADKTLIPTEQRSNYSEKIIFLPNSYQPNDCKRSISKKNTTRDDFDLPKDSFIFCCFNTTYKITPVELDIWSRVLKKVENSILWLIDSNEITKKNLLSNFRKKNIDPKRIIFAKNIPHDEHLERIKHVDLFLDTFNYNAHTTCSDTLWSGTPIVTKIGDQFAARVASSLLKSMNLNELITTSNKEYENLIIELANNKHKLKKIKDKISNNLSKSPLFDTKKYSRNFEKALTQAYKYNLQEKEVCDIEIN